MNGTGCGILMSSSVVYHENLGHSRSWILMIIYVVHLSSLKRSNDYISPLIAKGETADLYIDMLNCVVYGFELFCVAITFVAQCACKSNMFEQLI